MTPRFEGFAEKVRASFSRQAMMTALGAELSRVAPGDVEIVAPVNPAFGQQHGYAHAGVTFALGDTAAGYAALSLMDETDEVLTGEMKVNLLAPATGPRLMATGRVIRAGRRLSVVTAEVWSGQVQVALMQGTMIPVPG